MARDGLFHSLLALVLLSLPAGAADDRIANTLAVQSALQQGRAHLLRSDFQEAVHVLEGQITRVDGNPQYLSTLRDAYRGLIKTLKLSGKDDDAAIYTRRLLILDPGASLDFLPAKESATKPPAAPAPTKSVAAPSKPKPAVKDEITARGVSREERRPDPFDASNHRKAQEARGHLEQAEKLFLSKDYAAAGDHYAKAGEGSPEIVAESRERWAYCKLSQVVERLNQNGKPVAKDEWPVLETQVRTAMAWTPKLEKFGQSLLTTIRERKSGPAEVVRPDVPKAALAVAVKHSRPAGKPWALAETPNFRIFHNLDEAKAEEVAGIAENTRTAMQQKWFGKVEDEWNPRCDVYLYKDAEAYARGSGVRGSAPGHARVSCQGERVLERQLHMRLDVPTMLNCVLPHETTHVVLAGRFGPFDVPRWADEGIAVLTEPADQVERHLRNLPTHRDEKTLFAVKGLLELADYPHPRQIGAFYAQSISVVDYLSGLKGPQTFAQFVKDGLRGGYEPALKKHYDMQGYNDLESRWQAHAFKEGVARSEKK